MSKYKTILFRTDDMNGAIAEVVLKTVTARKFLHETVICEASQMSMELESFLTSGKYMNYSRVYIVGAGFDKNIAEKIDLIMQEEPIEFVYRDHHESSLDLSKYMWGRILLFDAYGNPISSSKNLFRDLVDRDNNRYIRLSLLVDMSNASITGYTPIEDEHNKKMIEELYQLAGSSEKFAQNLIEKIMSEDAFFNEADIIAKIEAERRAREEEEEQRRALKEKFKRRNTGL